ncbi:CRISPR-associated protein Csx15 [Ktedonospora formicarum]|uniref:Uncharacterized protein n=1 Tax=Ktedonospora formicarum TaxID=2778364 RepID=A0A8J3I911_9CHLR|nr:CRISPR-associated protein Csx15 [Ktedonospora formicarum]GHO49666.1 hypothetical protein KSX_78290 [Ktedonospora formicarum]
MIVLNFSHPLTLAQQEQIERLAGRTIEEVRTIPVQIDQEQPMEPQIVTALEMVHLTTEQWQTFPLVINPPGYAPASMVLLAELHGRIGHFPVFIRLRPRHGTVTTYEVAELLNLQIIRDNARKRR